MIRVILLILTQKCGSINVCLLLFLRLIDRIKKQLGGVHVVAELGRSIPTPNHRLWRGTYSSPKPPQIVKVGVEEEREREAIA
jgi:hypothetical protein